MMDYDICSSETTHKKLLDRCMLPSIDNSLRAQAQRKIDTKTKPLGALGHLETLSVNMCCIQHTLSPRLNRKAMFVFAADHGIAVEGVSAFPQEVTRQMVLNFLKGGAAINVLSRHGELDLFVIDIGIKGPPIDDPVLIQKRITDGTNNFACEPAMTSAQVELAITTGADLFFEQYNSKKIDIIGLGEMGIANTTAASAIISTITGIPVAQCTGRGTGVDDAGLQHKIKVLEKALLFHKPDPSDACDILCKVGGLEIAGIVGAVLAAASKRCAVVLDGLICTAAGLIAYTINPAIADYLIAGHKSVEIGHMAALKHMGLIPVLDLGMRLGEGTGAALTINLVDIACHIMNEMASFEDAGVSEKNKE
jgi:nicotinate-nucleotide--dimethylbenzimidazole phosphoribosyltransferase